MYRGLLARLTALATLAAVAIAPAVALAASQLTGVSVTGLPNKSARVELTFGPPGVPPGWHVTGSGTTTVTIALPGVTQAPNLNAFSYAGANAVISVTLAQHGSELDVTVQLSSPVAVAPRALGASIYLDAAAPQAKPVRPAPQTGGPSLPGSQYAIIPLKYADVGEVVGLLVPGQQIQSNDTFSPSGSIFSLPTSSNGTPNTSQPSSPFSALQAPTSLGERVNDQIGYDRRLNAIIVYGTPAQIASIRSFVSAIDIPLPSVMLECQVVELNETAAHDLGIDFTNGAGAVATGGAQLGVNGSGASSPALFSGTLQAALYATIQHGGGQVLDSPRILAVNGSAAQILTGDAIPIISTTLYPGAQTVSQENVNYVAVGINLQIQPRIDPSGYVTSHIFAEVSSVTSYLQTSNGPVPEISLRQVSTEATVQDGTPFIVGGLLKDEEINNLSKLPGIGDLPIIGQLFRVRHDSVARTNLYILITPHIIRQVGVPNPGTPIEKLQKPQVPGVQPEYPAPSPAASP